MPLDGPGPDAKVELLPFERALYVCLDADQGAIAYFRKAEELWAQVGACAMSHTVVYLCRMDRATEPAKAERLNHARDLLQRFDHLPDAVAQMVKDSGISPRQAYRYLQQAQRLTQPVPVGDVKVAFTVKLSQELVRRLRVLANRTGLSLSEIVSRALLAALPQRRRRG